MAGIVLGASNLTHLFFRCPPPSPATRRTSVTWSGAPSVSGRLPVVSGSLMQCGNAGRSKFPDVGVVMSATDTTRNCAAGDKVGGHQIRSDPVVAGRKAGQVGQSMAWELWVERVVRVARVVWEQRAVRVVRVVPAE